MRLIRAEELKPRDRHHLMLSTVLPRPIAWVMSRSGNGVLNLAPFSYFNGISGTPPLVSISVSKRRSGELKDTRRNLEETKECVVHVVDEAHAHQMVETSADHPPDVSEVDAVGLRTVPSTIVQVPRLADAPAAMECRLVDVYEPPAGASALLILEILAWHVQDGLIQEREGEPLRVDVHRLRPVARLAGADYCPVREVFTMQPPA